MAFSIRTFAKQVLFLLLCIITLLADISIHALELCGVQRPKSTRIGYIMSFLLLTLMVSFWVGTTKTTTTTPTVYTDWFFPKLLISFEFHVYDSIPSALTLLFRAVALGLLSIVLLIYRTICFALAVLTLLLSSHVQVFFVLILAVVWL